MRRLVRRRQLLATALIIAPVAVSPFIVQGVLSRGQIRDLMAGSLPFVFALLTLIAPLALFANLAPWLPYVMAG